MTGRLFSAGLFLGLAVCLAPFWAHADEAANERMSQWVELNSAGRHAEAEKKALEMISAASDHETRCRAITCLAASVGRQDRFAEEEQIMQEAMKYCAANLGQDSHMMAEVLEKFGNMKIQREDYDDAAQYLRQAIAMYARHPRFEWITLLPRTQLARIYRHQGKLTEADQLLSQLTTELRRVRDITDALRTSMMGTVMSIWGQVAQDQERNDLAEPRFREAMTLFSRVDRESPAAAEAANNVAVVMVQQNRHEEARPYLEWALKAQERRLGPNHSAVATTLGNLALSNDRLGRHEEALEQLKRALAIYKGAYGAENTFYANHELNLASRYASARQWAEAEPAYRHALAVLEKIEGPNSVRVALALYGLAWVWAEQERFEEARVLVNRAIRIYDAAGAADDLCDNYYLKARIDWQLGQREEALATLAKAMDAAERQRTRVAGAELERAIQFGGAARTFEQMVAWQLELGNPEQALLAIERWRARSFVDELQLGNVDLLAGRSPQERAQMAAREGELRGRITSLERQLERLTESSQPADQSNEKRDRLLNDLATARNALYQHWRELRATSSVYQNLISVEQHPPSVADLQTRLIGPDGLALAYLFGENGGYLVTIGAEGAEIFTLVVDDTQAAGLGVPAGPLTREHLSQILVDAQGTGVVQQLADRERATEAAPRLALLWQVLMPEAKRTLITGGKLDKLIALPDGPLALLPLETLIVSTGETPTYLLDAGPPVIYGPSATVLMDLGKRGGKSTDAGGPSQIAAAVEPVLTLGNPEYAIQPTRSNADSANALAKLASRSRGGATRARFNPLPYSGIESSWVKAVFGENGMPAVRLTGKDATEANLRKKASGRRVLHLACHGLSDDAYGNFFGSLAVATGNANDPSDDGMLRLSEIYGLRLEGCELAILSACMTNYGPEQAGEGVWALSRGFLVAGAKRVVASNWLVDDEAAASLVSVFCRGVAEAEKKAVEPDYARSLQVAKKWVRKQEKWQSPYFWGTFVLIGPK